MKFKLPHLELVVPAFTFLIIFTISYLQLFGGPEWVSPQPDKEFGFLLASESRIDEEIATVKGKIGPSPTPSKVTKTAVKSGAPAPSGKVTNTGIFPGTGRKNNKFGMYMLPNVGQVPEVAKLVNSNGGDWGYVLIPVFITERSPAQLQPFFTTLKEHHLIPIVQLSAHKFNPGEFDWPGIAGFLGSLEWPTNTRFITIFNETNDEKYWDHRIAPEEYAVALNDAVTAFKTASGQFFMMNGAFNSSARSGSQYLSEDVYMQRMNNAVPGIFKRLDGWATHPYPQPEFSGDIYNMPGHYQTRDQIRNYEWEMQLLRGYGVSGLPIFATETGWAHKEGNHPKKEYKPATQTAKYLDDAFRNHWLPNPQIVAILPFIWKMEIASNFEWVKPDGTYYPQYDVMKNIPKVKGARP
jgi:hypothetical protein